MPEQLGPVIIVPCTRHKVWDADAHAPSKVAAVEAYGGPSFRRWVHYARSSGCRWFILSTKYGLLSPTDPISNYNRTPFAAARDEAYLQKLRQQGRRLRLAEHERIVLLDWERFRPLVRAAVDDPETTCVVRRLKSNRLSSARLDRERAPASREM